MSRSRADTPTPTPLVGQGGTGLALMAWGGLTSPSVARYLGSKETGIEQPAQLAMPSAGRVCDLQVWCSGTLSSGGYRITLRGNGSAQSLSCDLGASATCADHTPSHCYSYSAATLLALQIAPLGTPNTTLTCRATTAIYSSSGGSHDGITTFGRPGLAVAPANGNYCGPVSHSGAFGCRASTADVAAWLMPRAGTLSGLGVRLGTAVSGGAETYTVHNLTQGVATDLQVTLAPGSDARTSTACSSQCAFNAGDRLVVQYTGPATATVATRNLVVEYAGLGTVMARGHLHTTSQEGYNFHLSGTPFTDFVYPAPAALRVQNLVLWQAATPAASFTTALCKNSTASGCTSALTTTMTTADTQVADLTHTVSFAAGDQFMVRVPGDATAAQLNVSFELVSLATPTPTP